jgi:hypothetical protein
MRNSYKTLVGKPDKKYHLEQPSLQRRKILVSKSKSKAAPHAMQAPRGRENISFMTTALDGGE